jgi:hypothetical protein
VFWNVIRIFFLGTIFVSCAEDHVGTFIYNSHSSFLEIFFLSLFWDLGLLV